jgi:hypothetical protein
VIIEKLPHKCDVVSSKPAAPGLCSYAQVFSENENFQNFSMLMERDTLHKHKIYNRSKKKIF